MTSEREQRHYSDRAFRQIAEANETFMFDILPTLTKREFEILLKKRPELYGRFTKLVENHLNVKIVDPAK